MDVAPANGLERWTQYVRSRPEANLGLRPEWRDVIAGTYGLRAHYLEAVDDGKCVGVLPLYEQRTILGRKVLVSIPYASYAGVLADTAEAGAALIAEAEELGRSIGARYLELRQLHDSGHALETRADTVTVRCRLDEDQETHLQRLKASTRQRIRQCLREKGLALHFGPEYLQDFHSLYTERMHAMGVPTHSFSFLTRAQSAFGDDLWAALVQWKGRPVAGAIYVVWHGTCTSMWLAAMRRAGKSAPGYHLYWGTMQRARERGLVCFDAGRAETGSGLLEFKRQWGEPMPVPYQYLALRGQVPPAAEGIAGGQRLITRLWRALPTRVAAALGPYACRRVPVW